MSFLRGAQLLRIASSLLALLGMTMLDGCGQKGPLYLPDSKQPVIQAPAPAPTTGTAPAPEKRDEEKEKPR